MEQNFGWITMMIFVFYRSTALYKSVCKLLQVNYETLLYRLLDTGVCFMCVHFKENMTRKNEIQWGLQPLKIEHLVKISSSEKGFYCNLGTEWMEEVRYINRSVAGYSLYNVYSFLGAFHKIWSRCLPFASTHWRW